MKYFPFEDNQFSMTMNAKAMNSPLIEVEEKRYVSDIALKNNILNSDYTAYFHSPPGSDSEIWELLLYVLNHMAADYPQFFQLNIANNDCIWTNSLLNTATPFKLNENDSLTLPPLDWLGRQVQEDLILMQSDFRGENICTGGHLCFGSVWNLREKLGKSFLEVHEPVPGFREQIGAQSNNLMLKLKSHRPAARLNWTIAPTDELNLNPDLISHWMPKAGEKTPQNAGNHCFLRVERQTMSRLKISQSILFTIKTYLTPISEIAPNRKQLSLLAHALQTLPAESRTYKGMDSYYLPLMEYIENLLRI